jgi:hypothetical protein
MSEFSEVSYLIKESITQDKIAYTQNTKLISELYVLCDSNVELDDRIEFWGFDQVYQKDWRIHVEL